MVFRKQKLKDKLARVTFEVLKEEGELPCSALVNKVNKSILPHLTTRSMAQHLKPVKFISKRKKNNVTYYSFKSLDSTE